MAPLKNIARLLPLAETRRLRGLLTEREHLARCRDAARREMRGANYSPDDRADCAAEILAAGLAETHGTPPRIDDARHSLTAYCGRARNYRRGLERERARDDAERIAAEDRQAWSMVDTLADAEPLPEPTSRVEAWIAAQRAVARLGVGDIPAADLLLYRLARDVSAAVLSAEVGKSHDAYRQAESRAAKSIRERFPDAAALMLALADVNPAPRIDPMDGSTVWLYGYADASRGATTHGKTVAGRMVRNLAAEWRTGTAGGQHARRAENAAAAREVCEVKRRRPRKPTPATARLTDEQRAQAEADAIRKLGRALAHA